ncbi:MAG: EamA family transporter [Pseudonocardiales bacterium]|nr:MAG: EamA family transporter [Pseudonocardiales bacterium]
MVTAHVQRTPPGGWPRPAVLARLAADGLGSVPPPALALAGIVSVQLGAALAKQLFAVTGPLGAVAMRVGFAAVILLVAWRPSFRVGRRALPVIIGYGVVLATMNMLFYEGIARIPLGVAVTIEFLGPLAIALVGSRRWLDVLWALLAAAGVALLTEGGGAWVGVLFVLGAAICWAGYILLAARLGQHTSGGGGLALAMLVASIVAVPFGVVDAGSALASPTALVAGLGVALLSSVLPYSLELEALRRLPARVFGVLMSLEPAVAAVAGLLVLGQDLRPAQWAAITLVVVASVGAARTGRQ